MIYLKNKTTGTRQSQSFPLSANSTFQFVLDFPGEAGEYYFVVAAGTSFRTETPTSILLVNRTSLAPAESSTGSVETKRMTLTPKNIGGTQALRLPRNTW